MPPHPSNGQLSPGVITYRHVQSSDAAYAQFEAVRLGIDPSKPVAVQQWSGLIAVNYPARAAGITRFLALEEAYKKCPDLICIHVATYAQGEGETEAKYHENPTPETHKVSLDTYRRESLKILKIFSAVDGAVVEKASIDESFFDLSVPVRQLLLDRYPDYVKTPPAGSSLGLDTPLPPPPPIDWTGLGELVPTHFEDDAPEDADTSATDRAIADLQRQLEEEETTWADVALALGAELMAKCRRRVFDELHYTCSAGIAKNKMLSKLCSAYKKPANQTVLRNAAVLPFLRPLKFQKIRFLGGKLGIQLAEATSATTVGDLWTVSLEDLQKALGEDPGAWVWEIVRGVDASEVEMKKDTKSMLSSKNFRPSISTWGEGTHWLRVLATDLVARLIEAREVTPGVWPKTIAMHRRNDSYNSTGKQIPFPFTSQLNLEYVFKHARRLLLEFMPGSQRNADIKDTTSIGRITSLALSLQGLERIESGQKGIEGFFAAGKVAQVVAAPAVMEDTDADDRGKRKASSSFVPLAAPVKKAKADIGKLFAAQQDAADERKASSATLDAHLVEAPAAPSKDSTASRKRRKVTPIEEAPPRASFVCPRCKETLAVPAAAIPPSSPATSSETMATEALERLKAEHADKHFAFDLVEAERKANRPPPKAPGKGGKSGGSKAKPKANGKASTSKGDIGSFFRNASSSK